MLGQKGSGESGYLGAPAAIANAVNDALRPLGVSINTLPLKVVEARRPDRAGARDVRTKSLTVIPGRERSERTRNPETHL